MTSPLTPSAPPPLYRALLRPARFASTGYLARADDSAAIVQEIEELFNTLPGERPHRPTWGSLIRTRRWEPNDEHLAQDLRADAADAIALHIKRVSFVRAEITRPSPTGRAVTLNAWVKIKATGQVVQASSTVTLSG